MKDLFTKTSTTSIVAVLFTLLGFALLAFIAITGHPSDDTTRVQLITGILALMGLPGAYYFGAAKNRSGSNSAVNSADTVNVNTAAPSTETTPQSQP